MLKKIILAIVVGVAVALAAILVGMLLVAVNVQPAVAVGSFLKTYAGAIGILAGVWYYFAGSPDAK